MDTEWNEAATALDRAAQRRMIVDDLLFTAAWQRVLTDPNNENLVRIFLQGDPTQKR